MVVVKAKEKKTHLNEFSFFLKNVIDKPQIFSYLAGPHQRIRTLGS